MFDELVELIGLDDTLALCRRYGGVSLYISRTTGRLDGVVSAQSIGKLVFVFAKESICVPTGKSHHAAVKRKLILQYREQHGMTETALHFGVTTRYVRLLGQWRKEGKMTGGKLCQQ